MVKKEGAIISWQFDQLWYKPINPRPIICDFSGTQCNHGLINPESSLWSNKIHTVIIKNRPKIFMPPAINKKFGIAISVPRRVQGFIQKELSILCRESAKSNEREIVLRYHTKTICPLVDKMRLIHKANLPVGNQELIF